MAASTPLTVGILGLGQIAQGYDEPEGPAISTHLKACQSDPRLRVSWISDVDGKKAEDVCRRWNLTADVVSPEDALRKSVDIVCIASPDETHPLWIERFLDNPPRIILCEKPLSESAARSRELISKAQAAKSVLVINFIRRWIPGIAPWLTTAAAGGFGTPARARLTYCRGLRHNACHGLDLIAAAIGSDVLSAARSGGEVYDFNKGDPTISALLEVRGGDGPVPVSLTGVDGRLQFVFDVEIVFSTGRIRIWNEDGIRVRVSGENGSLISEFHDEPARHMQYVWKNLADSLSSDVPLLCGATDTLPGAILIDAIANTPAHLINKSIS
jgi:predicted dehydrogenase